MSQWFQERQKQSLFILIFMIIGFVWMDTRPDPQSPEAQVRAAITEMIEAAERKDLGPFKKHLSEEVEDETGRDKKEIISVLQLIFLRNANISLSLLNLDVGGGTNPAYFDVDLTLLMGQTVVPSDRGNFFLTFRNEGESWRVYEVRWDGGYGY